MSQPEPLWIHNPVATSVRAEMARRGITANRLPALIGQSQPYWARRMTGRIAFDVDDLIALAKLLDVHPGVFFSGYEDAPQAGPGGQSRAWRDSNPQPADP